MDSFCPNVFQGAQVRLVDVSKIGDTLSIWNLHIGGIQVATKQNVYTTPLSVKRWDGAYLKGWSELSNSLCAKTSTRC